MKHKYLEYPSPYNILPKVEQLNPMSNFGRNCHIVFHNGWTILYSYQLHTGVSIAPHSCQPLLCFCRVCDSFLKPHFFSWLVFTQAFHGLALAVGTGRFPSHSTLAWGSRENWWVPFEGGIWLLRWKKLSAWGAWEMFLLLAKQWSCHVNGPIDLWKEMVLPAGGYREMRMEKYHGQILHINRIKVIFVVEEFSLSYELGRELKEGVIWFTRANLVLSELLCLPSDTNFEKWFLNVNNFLESFVNFYSEARRRM